jgi:23S rRNA (guanosine2251-2'-O)-methyltransferase
LKKSRKDGAGRNDLRIRFSDDLTWGIHPVLELLRTSPERITELILQKERRGDSWQEIIDTGRAAGVRMTFVERFKIIGSPETNVTHQGVVARAAPVALVPFDEILETLAEKIRINEHPRVLACDTLQDPHNLGAIIRSAHASGVGHVLLTRERSAPLGGTAAKAAAGSLSHVEIAQVTNLVDGLQRLKDIGMWVLGAVKDPDGRSVYETEMDMPTCLVIGNEARGIRPLVRRQCDILVSIPTCGDIESLNSSVAGAVIMFEMYRQRLAADSRSGPN